MKAKSAISAAFELCVHMEPKARPNFEYKDNIKPAVAVRRKSCFVVVSLGIAVVLTP